MDSEGAKKEATILGLSIELKDILNELQNRLDNRFGRNPKPEAEAKVAERPVINNVLDEVLENLEGDRAHLSVMMSFISSDVLPKIN